MAIVKDVQRRHFAAEVAAIQKHGIEVAHRKFNRSSDAMVDGSGLLRVGGRLRNYIGRQHEESHRVAVARPGGQKNCVVRAQRRCSPGVGIYTFQVM